MEDVLKTFNLFDDNEIFRGYTTMIELCNALKFITMLLFIQNIFKREGYKRRANCTVYTLVANPHFRILHRMSTTLSTWRL